MAEFINIAEIVRPENRQRKEVSEERVRSLAEAFANPELGLLHPVVLRQWEGKMVLVAGETRTRGFEDNNNLGVICFHGGQQVPPGMIPYTTLGQMTPLAAWEAELEENVNRTDLTWQDRAAAREELFRLRNAQADAAGKPPVSYGDLTEEIYGKRGGSVQGMVRDEIILARNLDDPEVRAAASPKDAMKVLQKKEQVARNEKLAREVGRDFTSSQHTLVNADSKQAMQAALPDRFDVIVTDPPYGMGADEFGDSGGKAEGAHGYADDPATLQKIMEWFPAESYRVAKPQAHLYLFLDFQWFSVWKMLLENAGWTVFRTPMIWAKPQGFRAPWPDKGPQRAYEMILFASKGGKVVQKMRGDVLTHTPDINLGHNAQKPVALYRDLLERSIIPGDQVFDAFGGTGPILAAAHELKCRATMVEIDPKSYGIAVQRLKDLK